MLINLKTVTSCHVTIMDEIIHCMYMYNVKASFLHTNVAAFVADCQADPRLSRLSLTELFSLACLGSLDHNVVLRNVKWVIAHAHNYPA